MDIEDTEISRDSRQKCRLTHFSITEEEDGHLGRINGGVCHDHVRRSDWKSCLSDEGEWS